jgi:non-specific serine/threonine protein kinase
VGTLEYQAPEILLKKPYDGKKKDIFSLGVLLFLLVTGIKPFEVPFGKDKLYKYILKKQYSEYWKQIKNNDVEVDELSNEFKLLFIKMIQFNPNDRISLDEIINNKWFDDKIINNEDLISEFKLRENIIKDKLETQKKSSSDDSQINNNNTKGKHRKKNSSIYKVLNLTINKIFEDNTQIHFLDTQFGFSNLFLITKLRNKPVDFFNCLAHLIIERIINVDRINPNKKILKFEIYYNNIQNNEESEKNNNSFHIEKKLSIVGVKFYEMPNNTYSIVFKKIAGNKFEYYEKVSQIKEIILDLLSSQIIINYV